MNIQFFDNPEETPNSRDDVKLKQLGFMVYEDLRRVMVGLELTPFIERPSIEITLANDNGQPAGSLNVIGPTTPNLSLVMHLRDAQPTETYHAHIAIYYQNPEDKERYAVDIQQASFPVTEKGEFLFGFKDEG